MTDVLTSSSIMEPIIGTTDTSTGTSLNGETHSLVDKIVELVTNASKRLSQISTNTNNSNKIKKTNNKIGPWKLGRTLGKGSTGRVRLAKNINTGKLAAVKILPKANFKKLENPKYKKDTDGDDLPYGIEREIIIMKLINHQNIMRLYDVWENKNDLYLILEYIEGGELFDYLIKRGKLHEYEAISYFKQIINGISYLHQFNICHRDLKPENLLLDFNKNIKIADFGMAALEISDKLLETSCGSPHYASPEIVAGKNYHGAPSDIWSCGVILFALLTGYLPFDDENIRKLLLKVQNGKYIMPSFLSSEAKDLISRMLQVNPEDRITMLEIWSHDLLTKYPNPANYNPWLNQQINLKSINLRKLDKDILNNLVILFHNCEKSHIINQLSQLEMNLEKLFYYLLMKYRNNHIDNPRSVSSESSKTPSITKSNSKLSLLKTASKTSLKSTNKEIIVSSPFNKKKSMTFSNSVINRTTKLASSKSLKSTKSTKSGLNMIIASLEKVDKEQLPNSEASKIDVTHFNGNQTHFPSKSGKRTVTEPASSLDPRIAGINSLLRAKSFNTPSSYLSLRNDTTGEVLARLGIKVEYPYSKKEFVKTSSSRRLSDFLKPLEPAIPEELNEKIATKEESENIPSKKPKHINQKPYKSLLNTPASRLPKLPTNKGTDVLKPITNIHTNVYKKQLNSNISLAKLTDVKVESQVFDHSLIPNPRFSRFSFNGILNNFESKERTIKNNRNEVHQVNKSNQTLSPFLKEDKADTETETAGDRIINSLQSNGTVLRKSPRSNLNLTLKQSNLLMKTSFPKSQKTMNTSFKGTKPEKDDEFVTVNIDDDTNYTNTYSTLVKNAIDETETETYNFINFSQETLQKQDSFTVDNILDEETIKDNASDNEDQDEEDEEDSKGQENQEDQEILEVIEDQEELQDQQEEGKAEQKSQEDFENDDFKDHSFSTYDISNVNIGKFNLVQPNLIQSTESLRNKSPQIGNDIEQRLKNDIPLKTQDTREPKQWVPKRQAPSAPRNWFQKLFHIEPQSTTTSINSNMTSQELFKLINKTLMLKKIEGTLKQYNIDQEFGLIDGVIPNKFGKLKFKIEIIDLGQRSLINLIKVKGSDKNFINLVNIVNYIVNEG